MERITDTQSMICLLPDRGSYPELAYISIVRCVRNQATNVKRDLPLRRRAGAIVMQVVFIRYEIRVSGLEKNVCWKGGGGECCIGN